MFKFKNNILRIALFFSFLLGFCVPPLVLAQSSATLDRIISQIEALYPPVEGYIISVEGSGLTLDLKRGMAVK